MLTWSDSSPAVPDRGSSGAGHCARFVVLLVAAAALSGVVARRSQPSARRGPAAVRALERATGADFGGGAAPASPDVAIIEIGPPMARRVAGDTLVLVFAVPAAGAPSRLLHVAIRWVREVPLDIVAW